MNKVLIISTEYPPASRSSGVQRIVNFSKYLPCLGWNSLVLTMHPIAYGTEVNLQQLKEQHKGVTVKRALAFNTAVHFAIKGRYLSWMALPDRWVSWVFFGFFSGFRMIKKHKPKVILCSYPHPSAVLLALLLHKATGLPLVADFRDPMLYLNSSVKGLKHKYYEWIERNVIKSCLFALFTTTGAIDKYIKVKYPEYDNKWYLIENGFDESSFLQAEESLLNLTVNKDNKVVLLHSGGIFPDERNPVCFFQAINFLVENGVVNTSNFEVILRAPSDTSFCLSMIEQFNLQDIVTIAPKINYTEALIEMLTVDGLLVLQGASCNLQVPAKLYEYFRSKRPILALTDVQGDTATLMRKAGLNNIAPLDDTQKIIKELKRFIDDIKSGCVVNATDEFVVQQSRYSRSEDLADLLNSHLN
jgi:glycosyltransferase involved in cell wall biosynthesis